MSSFTSRLLVSPLTDGRRWEIMREFEYHVGYKGSSKIITVPAGFITDFASVPRPFWAIIPRWGKHGNAAVIHDYLYWVQTRSRKESDDIFLEAMTALNVRKITRTVMYWAVRLFGWIAWSGNQRKSIQIKLPPKRLQS